MSVHVLRRRIDRMIAALEKQQEHRRAGARVILCDQDGELLPSEKPLDQHYTYLKRIILGKTA